MCFLQNLSNEEQVVVIHARTVLTLAEKVTSAPEHTWTHLLTGAEHEIIPCDHLIYEYLQVVVVELWY